MNPSIVLTGYRRCGKSTVGKILSRRTGLEFVDEDVQFEKQHGSINDFQAKHGLVAFRAHETAVLEAICSQAASNGSGIVLATGGGMVAHDDAERYRMKNVQLLKSLGLIFYLIPSLDLEESARILAERIKDDPVQRFAHTNKKLPYDENLEMLTKRHDIYKEAADVVIITGRLPQEDVATLVSQRYCALFAPSFSLR